MTKEKLEKDFKEVISEIKSKIDNTKLEIFQNANMSLLKLYFYIGQTLVENSKYGNNFINNLSIELKISYPDMKGFSVRNLKNMRKYYLVCSNNKKVQKASALIPWSHNILIFDKIKDDEKRIWYINQTAKNGWGYYELSDKIKYNAYSRHKSGNKLNNFNKTLPNPQDKMAKEIMKDPYIFDITTQLLALQFDNQEPPKFNDTARKMEIDNQDFTIYYSNECPYVQYEVKELSNYAKENNIKLNFIKIDTLEKAKNAPCIFNNWANFYQGKFISNTILNANSLKKILK